MLENIITLFPEEDIINIRPELGFSIVHKQNNSPNRIDYKLHSHEDIYEIVWLLNGDCEFEVEGNTYKIKPGDIVFTRPFELHHILCLTEKMYERVILYIRTDFFKKRNCGKYLDIFENRELGTGNLVYSKITDNSLRSCMKRLLDYYNRGAFDVAEALVTEFLYLINNTNRISDDWYTRNERIREIIMYINNNLTERLSLDEISSEFYIDKAYLCKSFKRNTGYTVNHYINYKRILLAQELRRNGQTWLQASMNAGFNSYAHFYKTYLKHMGKKPSA